MLARLEDQILSSGDYGALGDSEHAREAVINLLMSYRLLTRRMVRMSDAPLCWGGRDPQRLLNAYREELVARAVRVSFDEFHYVLAEARLFASTIIELDEACTKTKTSPAEWR